MSNVLQAAAAIIAASPHRIRMIEIGTADGRDLYELNHQNLESLISIDPMYDWVPDVGPTEPFEESRVSTAKVEAWFKNSDALHPRTSRSLIVAKSNDRDVLVRDSWTHLLQGTHLLVIDGCHNPPQAVEDDYWNFRHYMTSPHHVLFDDINHHSPGLAYQNVWKRLADDDLLIIHREIGGYVGVLEVR